MERLTYEKKRGINGNALRTWALLFAAAGIIGRGVIQTHMLGIGTVSTQQLLEIMGSSPDMMTLATASIVMQALETCAVPIFALLLVEGVMHTSDFKAYALRVAGTAVLAEIPYNLAMGGKLLDLSSRNPMFSVLMCMAVLHFFRLYNQSGMKNVLIRIAVVAAGIIWCAMLKIEFGLPMILIVVVMWALRSKPMYRNFAGAAAAMVCTVYSPFFLASPMGFMAVHFYNEEPSTNSRRMNYLAYPGILLISAVVGLFL